MAQNQQQASILIVGAGPVGLVLANALAQHQIKFTLIDKNPCPSVHSKALSVNAATLKLFHNLGMADEIVARGKKMHDVFVYFNRHRVTHINKRFIDSPYNCFVTIPQPETEATLEHALNSKGLNVTRHVELTDINMLANQQVAVTLHNSYHNQTHQETHDYVIACDGANSTVRTLLDIPWQGRDFQLNFIVADIDLTTQLNSTSLHYFVTDHNFIIILPMQGQYTRVVICDPEISNLDDLHDIHCMTSYLNKHLPEPNQIKKILWFSAANIYNRLAGTNQLGNVFLAGDAFHLFSPIGGMGMNTGVQDAFNLAWKLIHCIKNKAKTCLLDSYATERMKQAQAVTAISDLNTEIITGKAADKAAADRYTPTASKRKYLKKLFPYVFSGFITKETDALYIDQYFPIMTGEHAPFIRFAPEKHGVNNSYELSATNQYCLLLGNEEARPAIEKMIEPYSVLVFIALQESLAGCHKVIEEDRYAVIRPDGYILFFEHIHNIQLFYKHLQFFYRSNHHADED